MRLKQLIVVLIMPVSLNAQDINQFCQTLSGAAEYCETAQAARVASSSCEACDRDLSSIASIFSYEMPKEAILKYCELAGGEGISNGVNENDQYCANPQEFVCGDQAGAHELNPKKVVDSLNAQQKKTAWLSLFYARDSGAISLNRPIGKMVPNSEEYKQQVFVGRENQSNLVTTFANEVLEEYSSTGDKSKGREEIKDKVVSDYGSYVNKLSDSSLASHQGFKDRLTRLAGNLKEVLITPDEYLSSLPPQPLPQSWKGENGKGYFLKLYRQYTNACGTDGLKPRMFFSRYKDGSGQVQERLVMCPGFIFATKKKQNGHELDGEVIQGLADFMTVPEKSVDKDLHGLDGNPEGMSVKEAELIDCYKYAGGIERCFPSPQGESACNNRASNSLGLNQKLGNELLDKIIADKGLTGNKLKSWLGKNMKGACGAEYAPAFSSRVRSVLKCETGMQFTKACLASGAVDESSSTAATELSCAHVCVNGGCKGNMPRLVQRNTKDGHFGAASGLNGIAPIALGPSFRGGKVCAYNKHGSNAFQSPLPLGYKCQEHQVAGFCDDKSESGCMKTWQSGGQWAGVSCYDNNGTKNLPTRVSRDEVLAMQQLQLEKKCEDAEARYASLSERRIRYNNNVLLDDTIEERVEKARGSSER